MDNNDDKKAEDIKPDDEINKRSPFSYINTETTYQNTKDDPGISESFAKELGLLTDD